MRLPLAMQFLAALALLIAKGPVAAAVPQVMTDIPPVQSLVAQVMGPLGTPGVLLSQGGDPHDLQLRPSQAAALSRADLVFWVGPELTPGIARAIAGVGLKGASVELIRAPGTFTMPFASDKGTGHGALNPHVWLDPDNARAWLKGIAARLAAADPEHAAQYMANAQTAAASVAAADAQVKRLLAPVGAAPLIVFHDAFGYYARHYGLNVMGSIKPGDATTPSAARLSDIRTILAATGPVCVFPEANQDSRLVQVVTEGTTARTGAALDLAGTMLTPGPGLYVALIKGIARSVAACTAQ